MISYVYDSIRFIHAADIHLGSLPHVSGELPEELNDIIKQATYRAFARICKKAIDYNVDFLVLSGDIYDREARSVKAMRFFNEQCERLQKNSIPVYIITGNHDPLRERGELLKLPENVHVIGSEQVDVREVRNKEGEVIARILGRSYKERVLSDRELFKHFNLPDSGVWNIGLLHTQLDPNNSNYLPCSLDDLRAVDNIHYWALGHIHKCRILQHQWPVVAYSGIPQGRDFGEEGLGGCLLVEMNPHRAPEIKFLPLSPVVVERVEVKIDEDPDRIPGNIPELEELVLRKAKNILDGGPVIPGGLKAVEGEIDNMEGYIIQWVITGRGEIHQQLEEQEEEVRQVLADSLRQRLRYEKPFIWTDSVLIRTGNQLPELEVLKDNNPVFREVEEVINLCLTDPGMREKLFEEIGQVWETNPDHERIDETRVQLDDDMIGVIIEQARQLVVEKLVEGRGPE